MKDSINRKVGVDTLFHYFLPLISENRQNFRLSFGKVPKIFLYFWYLVLKGSAYKKDVLMSDLSKKLPFLCVVQVKGVP